MISNVAAASEIWVNFTPILYINQYTSLMYMFWEIFWGVDELQHTNIKYL